MKTQFTEEEAKQIKSSIRECDILLQGYHEDAKAGITQLIEQGYGADAEVKSLYKQVDILEVHKIKLQESLELF